MSLTVGAIASGIGSAISNIGQGALTIIRIIAIVGFATVFAGAILGFFGLVSSAVMTSVVGVFFTKSIVIPYHTCSFTHALLADKKVMTEGVRKIATLTTKMPSLKKATNN